MEMFADVSEEEEGQCAYHSLGVHVSLCDVCSGDEADEAQLLAAALKEDEEPEDNSVTAI